MLSGIDSLNIISTENELGKKPLVGNNFDATLANKYDSVLLDLGIELILKEINLLIRIHTLIW